MAVLVLFIETILVTILMIGSMMGLLNNSISPWVLAIFWVASIVTLFGTIIVRRYYKHKYKRELAVYEKSPDLQENEYFYQAPLYIFDGIHIKIHGMTDTIWTPYFNNNLQKWLSAFDISSFYGVKFTSSEHNIILKRINLWSLRPHYSVFIDGQELGILKMIQLLKGGIKQQTPYVFSNSNHLYKFNNPYFSTKTIISEKESREILVAQRSFFDLGKNLITRRRGENHNIAIESNTSYPHELWLALYIQVMINKQKNQ
ncbi:hypothetical protein [Staphylococcus equorum]|uniref:hypothetical protein n=1 Tax=Staphylococcus equorum TaxID=246432 RepID=UPI00080620FC|nr:hypothetical protein [Staphylococcus equorum]ANQ65672.1 hypothetical protein AVJ22_13475 [Staphylococcus equorum]